MERSSTTPFDDDAQLVLDELYWNTTTTMKAIAAQLGIPAPHVSRLARPLAAGIDCWWCREPLTYASRSERSAHGPVACRGCRASTPRFLIDLGLEPTDAIIVLTTSGHRSPADLSAEVADGARALAMIGLRWTGAFESIDVRRGPAIVGGAIGILPADIAVISSVRALGVSQGDAFAAFRRVLQQTRVRVVTARDAIWASERESGYRYQYDRSWHERVSIGSDFPDDVSDGGRSWADEYRLLGLDDGDWDFSEERSTAAERSRLRFAGRYG